MSKHVHIHSKNKKNPLQRLVKCSNANSAADLKALLRRVSLTNLNF